MAAAAAAYRNKSFFKIKLLKKRSHTRRYRGPRRNTWRSSFLVWLRQNPQRPQRPKYFIFVFSPSILRGLFLKTFFYLPLVRVFYSDPPPRF